MSASVESPCIGVCRLTENRICQGCGRSLAEIGAWLDADDIERVRIRRAAARRLESGGIDDAGS